MDFNRHKLKVTPFMKKPCNIINLFVNVILLSFAAAFLVVAQQVNVVKLPYCEAINHRHDKISATGRNYLVDPGNAVASCLRRCWGKTGGRLEVGS